MGPSSSALNFPHRLLWRFAECASWPGWPGAQFPTSSSPAQLSDLPRIWIRECGRSQPTRTKMAAKPVIYRPLRVCLSSGLGWGAKLAVALGIADQGRRQAFCFNRFPCQCWDSRFRATTCSHHIIADCFRSCHELGCLQLSISITRTLLEPGYAVTATGAWHNSTSVTCRAECPAHTEPAGALGFGMLSSGSICFIWVLRPCKA